nr:cupin domain-containing protein [Ardenticatena sp.]
MSTTTVSVTPWDRQEPATEAAIRARMAREGLSPYRWGNAPHDVYGVHSHPYHKVIYVVQGSITFHLPDTGEDVTLYAGDRLDLPAGVRHAATVGPDGVVCLEAHR